MMSVAQWLARASVTCAAVGAIACTIACTGPGSRPASSATEPAEPSPSSASAPAAEPTEQPGAQSPDTAAPPAPALPARPALRRLFAAHPKTVARQVPADNDARIEAHLAAHPDTPADIATAIRAHEVWLGMTEAEVVLSVGPATRQEPVTGKPGAYGLFYAGEGWFLSFDDNGHLYELVER